MGMAAAQAIAELFDSEGARDYLGEPVSVASHLLQAGALASAAGATGPSSLHEIVPGVVAPELLRAPERTMLSVTDNIGDVFVAKLGP